MIISVGLIAKVIQVILPIILEAFDEERSVQGLVSAPLTDADILQRARWALEQHLRDQASGQAG